MRQDKPASTNHRLIQARQRKCWSQETVAGKLGTTRVTISRWEQGLRFPSPHYRELLCSLFDSNPEALGLLPMSALPTETDHDDVAAGLHLLAQRSGTSTSTARQPHEANDPLQPLRQMLASGSTLACSARISALDLGDEPLASTLSRDLFALERFSKSLDASARIMELYAQSFELFAEEATGQRQMMVAWRVLLQQASGMRQEFVLLRLPDGSYHPVGAGTRC